jgi:hypothetical protein
MLNYLFIITSLQAEQGRVRVSFIYLLERKRKKKEKRGEKGKKEKDFIRLYYKIDLARLSQTLL